jgi:inositol 2-dehydrogenase
MNRRVRIGLVGLGRLGQLHAEHLASLVPSAELVRVVDSVEDAARVTGTRLGVEWSTSYDDLLNDPRIEAVAIVTPTTLHAEQIEQAARAGKHVFCEKPVSFDRASGEKAVAAARAAGVKLQIGFHRRFDPDFAAVTARVRGGGLGSVLIFRISHRDQRLPPIEYLRTSGGFFADATIHDFDQARWMVGEIDEVTAFGAALLDPAVADLGDVDTALVRFTGGAYGAIDSTRGAAYGYEVSAEVVGTQGTARVGNHRRTHVEWLTPENVSQDHVATFRERFRDAYRLELEDFAQAVRDDRPVKVTGDDGVAALALSEAAALSCRSGRAVRLQHRLKNGHVTYSMIDEG